MHGDHPLQLEEHLRLRSELSTVQRSSIVDIWNASGTGNRVSTCLKFLKARTGAGKLSSGEFIQFGFCTPHVPYEHIASFAGKQAQQAFNRIYNDKTWYALTKNKMAFEALMRGGKIPCPETIAIYDRKGRGAGAPVLKSVPELEAFLLDSANHPVFCKPTTGLLSIGSFRIDHAEGQKLVVNGAHQYEVVEVIQYITGLSRKGYLFQKVLEPHESFSGISCNAIASARYLVLNRDEEAMVHSCALKLPADGEVADNFWRNGSVLCSVDIEAGRIVRAVSKQPEGPVLLSADKDTRGIYEFTLPDFEAATQTILKAARFLSGVKVQSWDVGFTNDGPKLIEVNFGGDLNLSQLSSNKGVLTPEFCSLLRESGYADDLPN